MHIHDRVIGKGNPVYIIAEGGLTNWGSLELAMEQVDMAMAAGADAIKFQAQTTEELVSKRVSAYWYQRLKYKELSYNDLMALNNYCAIRNIDFSVTPHTIKDLEFVTTNLDISFLKIGSGESLDHNFLNLAGQCEKPVVMSVGLHQDVRKVIESVEVVEKSGCRNLSVLFCNTVYPTPPDTVNLGMMNELQQALSCTVGYSDHTVGTHIALAAVAVGACILEKHICFEKKDRRSFDCAVSCDPGELYDFVTQIREVESALKESSRERTELLDEARTWARQSIVAAEDLRAGMVLDRDNLVLKRPGTGLGPELLEIVVGKVLKKDVFQDELLMLEDLQEKV